MEMGLKEEIAKLITDASAAIGKPMIEGIDFEIIHQPLNHTPLSLPNGKMAVYTFYYKRNFLKIGKANIKIKLDIKVIIIILKVDEVLWQKV